MATIKYLADIDLNGNGLNNAVIQNLSSAPSSPKEGQIYYDTGDNTIYFNNAATGATPAWIDIGSTGDITSVVAGAGMTGGGTSGDATINVIGGTGITANADNITIDSTVVTKTGSQTLTNKTIAASQVTEISNITAAEGAQIENIGTTTISATQWGYLGAATGAITNTDTNTQLSTEAVQDIVGAMTTGNTESGITVAYQDADGTLDFTVGTLNQNTTGNAATVTTNANLTGHITSSGNAAVLGSFTIAQLSAAISNASISGNNTGDQTTVSGSSGSCTGNAATATLAADATTLATPRAINGVDFDGSAAITVTAAAGTLSGNTLKSTVVASSLTSLGTVATGVWNASVIPSAKLDADTAHLTTAQTFTGSKTMGTNVKLNFRDANAYINSPTANDIEVAATTITLDAASDIQLEGNTTVTGNFSVSGTLNVDGTTTTIDSTTVAIADSMLKLAKDQNTDTDAVDFGFYGAYGDGTQKYAGVFRDLSADGNPFVFFDELQAEPGATVNTAGTGYAQADVHANLFKGSFSGPLTGNASTATTLANARTIGGVSFNGGANINLPGVNSAGNQNTSGSAATLTTARTIGGVSFNGSADINLPGVNTAGNQATSGLAGTATKLATTRAINGVNFDGTAAITVTAAAGTLSGNTLKSTVVASSLTSVGTIGTGVWNGSEITTEYTDAKVYSIVAGAGIDVNNSGVGDVTVTAETASATNPGIVELATTAEALTGTDTTRAVTAAGLAARSYRAAIGGATAIAVTHSLGTKDVMVQMYDASSFETVMAQVVRNSTSQVTVTFNTAPSAGDVIILVTKID